MAEIKEKHLEIIQGIINRLANNSFFIKGWAITLLTALFAVYAASEVVYFILISILPTFIFWFLDSYYLWQERQFRRLYQEVVSGDYPSDYSINLNKVNTDDINYFSVVFSKTIWPLYIGIIVLICLTYYFSCYA